MCRLERGGPCRPRCCDWWLCACTCAKYSPAKRSLALDSNGKEPKQDLAYHYSQSNNMGQNSSHSCRQREVGSAGFCWAKTDAHPAFCFGLEEGSDCGLRSKRCRVYILAVVVVPPSRIAGLGFREGLDGFSCCVCLAFVSIWRDRKQEREGESES